MNLYSTYITGVVYIQGPLRFGHEEVLKWRKKGKTGTVMRMKNMRGAWKKTDKVMKRMLNDKLLITCPVKEIIQSDDPGLWLKMITDRDREAIVRTLVTRDGDVQTPQDSEGKPVRQPVGGKM